MWKTIISRVNYSLNYTHLSDLTIHLFHCKLEYNSNQNVCGVVNKTSDTCLNEEAVGWKCFSLNMSKGRNFRKFLIVNYSCCNALHITKLNTTVACFFLQKFASFCFCNFLSGKIESQTQYFERSRTNIEYLFCLERSAILQRMEMIITANATTRINSTLISG